MSPVPGGDTSRGGRLPRLVRPSYTHLAEDTVEYARPAEQEAYPSYTYPAESCRVLQRAWANMDVLRSRGHGQGTHLLRRAWLDCPCPCACTRQKRERGDPR